TIEELRSAIQQLHDPENELYGIVRRGHVSGAITQLSSFLYGFGGDWLIDDEVAIDSPEAIDAYKYYGDLLRDYEPPGNQDMNWEQALPIFAQGNAVFNPDGDSLFTNFLDETQSNVVDDVGFAVIPAGPAGSHPYNVPNTAYGISAYSEHQDEA